MTSEGEALYALHPGLRELDAMSEEEAADLSDDELTRLGFEGCPLGCGAFDHRAYLPGHACPEAGR